MALVFNANGKIAGRDSRPDILLKAMYPHTVTVSRDAYHTALLDGSLSKMNCRLVHAFSKKLDEQSSFMGFLIKFMQEYVVVGFESASDAVMFKLSHGGNI